MTEFHSVMSESFGSEWNVKDNSDELVVIDELPVMFTEDNYLACLPELPDEPVLGFIGMRSSGKTTSLAALLSRVFHYWDKDCIIGNDSMNESLNWTYKNHSSSQQDELDKIKEKPMELPIVFCAPKLSGELNVPGYIELSIPSNELFKSPERYLDLGKSKSYFLQAIDGLDKRNKKTVGDAITNNIEMKNVKEKLLAILNELYLYNVVNDGSMVSDVKVLDEVANGKYEEVGVYNFLSASLMAGLIPSLLTGEILEREALFPSYLSFWFRKLYDMQKDDPYFKNRELWVFIDELKDFFKYGNELKEIVNQIARRGRPVRMGMAYCTQFYTDVPPEVAVNTTFTFVFGYKNSKQINSFCSDHNLPAFYKRKIRKLDHFHAMGVTSEHFVLYNSKGERFTTKHPIIGKMLPPLCAHEKPKKDKSI